MTKNFIFLVQQKADECDSGNEEPTRELQITCGRQVERNDVLYTYGSGSGSSPSKEFAASGASGSQMKQKSCLRLYKRRRKTDQKKSWPNDDHSSSDSDDDDAQHLFMTIAGKIKALATLPGAVQYPGLMQLAKEYANMLGDIYNEDFPSGEDQRGHLDAILKDDSFGFSISSASQRHAVIEQLLTNGPKKFDGEDPLEAVISQLAWHNCARVCLKGGLSVRKVSRLKKVENPSAGASWDDGACSYFDPSVNYCKCSPAQSGSLQQERLCLLTNPHRYPLTNPSPVVYKIPPEGRVTGLQSSS